MKKTTTLAHLGIIPMVAALISISNSQAGDMKNMEMGVDSQAVLSKHSVNNKKKFKGAVMMKDSVSKAKAKDTTAAAEYICPMHSDYVSDKPGKCPKCGMTLERHEKKKVGH